MLPAFLLAPLWLLAAAAWPVARSLHCLRAKAPETRLWLFYWQCFAACLLLLPWLGWAVRLPFRVLALLVADIEGEAHVLFACWLVLPRTMGIRQVHGLLTSMCGDAVGKLVQSMLSRITLPAAAAASVDSAAAPFRDKPGLYTVLKAAGVMPTMGTAKGVVLSQLDIGAKIHVLEVVHNEAERRVRARLEQPEGWISLLNMDTGARWAVHEADPAARAAAAQAAALPKQAGDIFANAAAAGCNPAALFQPPARGAPAAEVSSEEAWEAMALLESQLARADDSSEDAASRQAAGMLRAMLTTLVQTGNPGVLAMAQAMMPDLGKIWADASTREYLQGLLTAAPGGPSAGGACGPAGGATDQAASGGAASSGSAAGASAAAMGEGDGAGAGGSGPSGGGRAAGAADLGASSTAGASAAGASAAGAA